MTIIKSFVGKYSIILTFVLAIGLSALIFIFKDEILKLSAYGYVGLFLLNILGSSTIVMPTPIFITAFAASTFLNPIPVFLVSSLGSSIGEITGYFIGSSSKSLVTEDPKFKRIKNWMDKYGLWTIFLLASIPNPFFDLAGIVAGATKTSLPRFFLAVWMGKLIKFGIVVLAGANSAAYLESVI